MQLHIGSGALQIEGWINIDIDAHPGVDHVLDVREGLPFASVDFIFAEHFIEHLTFSEAATFLTECRRVLSEEGSLRVSTPNLDWVWLTHYKHPQSLATDEAVIGCLEMNRAFHGWGHQFLYNAPMLARLLEDAGFEAVELCRYGESTIPELRNLERHEPAEDRPGVPHVVIAQAHGIRSAHSSLQAIISPYLDDLP